MIVNQTCSSSILNWVITQEYVFTGWTANNSMLWYIFESTQLSTRMLVVIATARKLRADFIAMTYFLSHQMFSFNEWPPESVSCYIVFERVERRVRLGQSFI